MSGKFENCWMKADLQLKQSIWALVFCRLFLWRIWWSIFFVFIKFSPLYYAAGNDLYNTIVKLFLLNGGFDVDLVLPCRNWTSLHRAIYVRASNNATTLLWYGASINLRNANNKTPMQIAQCWRGNIAKIYRQWMAMRKFDCFVWKDFYFIFVCFLF